MRSSYNFTKSVVIIYIFLAIEGCYWGELLLSLLSRYNRLGYGLKKEDNINVFECYLFDDNNLDFSLMILLDVS